jgi:tetratricopeptide (TPR) repeat protein
MLYFLRTAALQKEAAMTWGLEALRHARRGWQITGAALVLLGASSVDAAQSLSDAPPLSLDASALYAAASAVRPSKEADVSVVEAHETYLFEADGSDRYTQHLVYKILTPAGVEGWNTMLTYWSPWRDEKPTMRARVISADGTAITLDPATIADSPARVLNSATYSDQRTLRAPLPAIAVGSVVETVIEMKEKAPLKSAGKIGRTLFQLNQPIQHFRLTLQAPASLPLRYRVDAAPGLAPTRTSANGLESWVFDYGPVAAAENIPPALPSDVHMRPMVTFSTGTSWQALAEEYSALVATRLAQANVTELATRLTKGRTTREERAAALVEYLNREIRYTGIEFNEAAIVPHTVAETLARKYGDCKDKALVLVALLRAVGIPANLALLNAGGRLDVPGELPGLDLFDHAIVHAPGEPTLWIDATAESARLGQLPDTDHGRLALVVDAQTTALTRIDEARSADNVIEEVRELRLADQGPAAVTEISTPRGNFEMGYRSIYTDVKAKQTVENLTEYMKNEYLIERLEKLDTSDPKDFSQPFRLTLQGTRAQRAATTLSEAAAYIRIDGLFENLPATLRTREPTDAENAKATRPEPARMYDYVLSRPYVVDWQYRVVPPAGFEAGALPESSEHELGPARFSERFSLDPDGAVRGHFRFDTTKRRFTPAEQRALRNSVAQLLNREAVAIKFDLKAHRLLAEGHARESFQAYRELVARNPKDAIQHLRRADGLLEAGMGEAARAEAALAIKLAPKSAFARQTQALVLQHDAIGRRHGQGADFAGAMEAYRAAIALDPKDDSLVANLAVLLEYNSRGERYGPGADLKAAIAQYRKLTSAQLAELEMPQNLAFALFYAGSFAESLKEATALDEPPVSVVVACIARLNGIAPALEEAKRRTSGTDLNETLTVAAQMLMSVREYASAAALFEAGASGAQTSQTLALVSWLRNARRHEDVKFADTPEDSVREGTAIALLGADYVDELDAFRSRNSRLAWQQLSKEESEAADRNVRAFVTAASRSGMSPDIITDLYLQAVQTRATGDDTLGYRVVMQSPGYPNQRVYVVKEDGKYKTLANAAWLVPAGLEVLERLGRHDSAGAIAIIAWARDGASLAGGDDPYAGAAFPRFWAQGQREAQPRAIELAAAAMLVQSPAFAPRAITVFEQAKASATTDEERDNIDFALLTAYELLRDHERSVELARALVKRTPHSRRLFFAQSAHLRALGRFDEADRLAQERLQAIPDDIDALRSLAASSAARHDYAGAYDRGLQIVANGNSGPADMNEVAWLSLFYARPGGPDVDMAVRATQGRENASAALHTLGCAYAEVGKTREAREVLLQAMDAANLAQPNSSFWYAFGRIAEQYGEREIALANYAKVTPPPDPALEFDSTYRLARNRMRALEPAR